MLCFIYKSLKKSDTYLYMENENDFSAVPDTLLSLLGKMELVMSLELDSNRKLAHADVEQVLNAIKQDGYYLQLPPKHYVSDQG